jgi:hypothetical protein
VWISSGSDARHMAACDDCPMMDGHQASARTS